MSKILDFSEDRTIATYVIEMLNQDDFSPEQVIAGLTLAIKMAAGQGLDGTQAIDEAVDALLDGNEAD